MSQNVVELAITMANNMKRVEYSGKTLEEALGIHESARKCLEQSRRDFHEALEDNDLATPGNTGYEARRDSFIAELIQHAKGL